MVKLFVWEPRKKDKPGHWLHFASVEKALEFARLVGIPGGGQDAERVAMERLARALSREFDCPIRMTIDGKKITIDEIGG